MKFMLTALIGLLFIPFPFCYAQKSKKPQLLVYGTGISAYTAALQSAKSGVPTLWVADTDTLLPAFSKRSVALEKKPDLDGGLWLDVLMHMAQSTTANDSLAQQVKNDMNPRLFMNAIASSLAETANLTVIRKQNVEDIKAHSKGWHITLASKQKYNLPLVVDASNGEELIKLLPQHVRSKENPLSPVSIMKTANMRTAVATGFIADTLYAWTLADVLSSERNGLFQMNDWQHAYGDDVRFTAAKAAIGQAVGATAAYLAFFKTTPDKIDVRKLQSEMMNYGMRIMPYADIAVSDPHFYAIQRFGLSGIIAGDKENGTYLFNGDAHVRYAEIQPILHRLFSRSQLWFADHQGEFFTWGDFLSLVKFVGLRGNEVDKAIEREWHTKLKFAGEFDTTKRVTRYQFAVILDRYASPYVKAVNQEGTFVN